VGGDAVGEVAGRGAADGVEAELDGLGQRDGDDAVLVGKRRIIGGVVLDVELFDAQFGGELVGADQRREARAQAGARLAFDREQVLVAPERAWPGLDRGTGDIAPGLLVVEGDLDGAEIVVTDGARLDGVERFALLALQ
jgi:hypothetical protein